MADEIVTGYFDGTVDARLTALEDKVEQLEKLRQKAIDMGLIPADEEAS